MSFSAGARVGPYEIRGQLGAGGMGEVYDAYDPRLRRNVALKLLPDAVASDAERRQRFEREALAIAALSHPNIVTIYAVDDHQGTPLLAMEKVEGRPLSALIPPGGMALDQLLKIGIQIAEAIAAAHAKGITHRDLKPDNILVTPEGRVKVLDFGLAKALESPSSLEPPASGLSLSPTITSPALMTSVGVLLGTAAYMAPEQAEGKAIDHRADLFSLGVILYELVTGQRPFQADSVIALLSAVLRDTPPLVTEKRPEIPAGLARLIRHGLEKNPAQRVQTATELRNALEEIARPKTSSVGRRFALVAGAVLVLAAAGVAIVRWPFAAGASAAIDSIAVLPFTNASGSPEIDYLSDGLTETLTNSLTHVPDLRVIPRTLAATYRNQTPDPRQVGRDLNVRAVVTGRITQQGDRLQVQAELIDVRTVAQLWGDRVEGGTVDALRIQSTLSRGVALALRTRLTAQDTERLQAGTTDPEAYQLYLRGRHEWDKRTSESLAEAVRLLEGAVGRDSSYAQAHAALAGVHNSRGVFGYVPSIEAFPKAIASAARAIALDDRSGEAHSQVAMTSVLYQWDWGTARREFARALELAPDDAGVRYRYAINYLAPIRQFDAAMVELEHARKLDPLSESVANGIGLVAGYTGRDELALSVGESVLAAHPASPLALAVVSAAKRRLGRPGFGLEEAQRGFAAGYGPAGIELGLSLLAAGRRAEVDALFAQGLRSNASVPLAMVAVALGQTDQAFALLEQGYRERHSLMWTIAARREFETVRADPRFQDLVRRIGIPQAAAQ